MSIGGGYSSTVQNACSYAAAKGVLLLGASGNSGDGNLGTTETSYPAAFSTVVSVGATRQGDGLASFSNTSPTVEVSGPGVSVKSTYKGNGYQTWNGTSMACPHACGVAALLLEEMNFVASVADLRAALVAHTDDSGPGGRDNGFGWGIVNYLK
jgi:serine protease